MTPHDDTAEIETPVVAHCRRNLSEIPDQHAIGMTERKDFPKICRGSVPFFPEES